MAAGAHDARRVRSHPAGAARPRIVELIRDRPVRSQTELLAMLAAEGIGTTQATLSRDLDELGAVKLRGADGGTGLRHPRRRQPGARHRRRHRPGWCGCWGSC